MNNNLRHWYKAIGVVSVVVGLGAGSVSHAWAGNPNPGVIPPNAKAYGMTYGQWSAKWWQWAFSLSLEDNPFFDESGSCDNGANGQSGPVWFLTGVINASGTAVRTCTVPAGKALFFPIINAECSTLEGNGSTEKELRTCAEGLINPVTSVAAEIDWLPIQSPQAYRVSSPLFTFGPLPEDNVLQLFGVDAPAGATSLSVADGYYLLLAPLPVGQHTIHFTGTVPGFTLDITYNLTVTPRKPQARLPRSSKALGFWGQKLRYVPKP